MMSSAPNAQPILVGVVRPAVTVVLLTLLFGTPLVAAPELQLDKLVLPEGFSISIYATGVANARSLARSPTGVVFIGTQGAGKLYAVVDGDGDGQAEQVFTIAEGLNMPNGVAWRDGALYVAEVNRILRFDDLEDHLSDPPEPVVLIDSLPTERHHGWKFIRFGPDGRLYVPVGAPCNICDVADPYAAILSMKPDGSDLQVFARGVRNTVGFDWHPETGELWFTENGRDMMGDDVPPDELNHAPEAGLHFGYPFCHGNGIEDPEKAEPGGCDAQRPPAQELAPHSAAVGMRFYTGSSLPESYHQQILIAEHGSWNRRDKSGYRLTVVRVDDSGETSYEPFVEGWLQGKSAWGRPVDLLVLPDGSLLVSDDRQGVIYRLAYSGS